MSEVVQKHLEAITDEIEELKRTSICKREEYTYIAKNYFNYENKIQSREKTPDVFKEYINYIMTVIKLIKLRRHSQKIGEGKHRLEYKMLHRVKSLYEMAIKYFPEKVELYLEFFKFCKEIHFIEASTSICNSMIKHHQSNPLVWLTAARWNFHEKKNHILAISLLHQGMNIHKDNLEIYKECLLYEMQSCVANIKSEVFNENDPLNERLTLYAIELFKNPKNTNFYLELLSWLENYPVTLKLQTQIIEHLLKEHINNEQTWEHLAQRERQMLHYCENKGIVRVRCNEALDNCIQMYERGIREISDEIRPKLWHLYTSCLVDINNEGEMNSEKIQRIMIPAFEEAAKLACMPKKCYVAWIKCVEPELARKVSIQATKNLPLSVDLWKMRLILEISDGDATGITKVFEDAVDALKDKAGPVWLEYLGYMVLNRTDPEIERCYLTGLELPFPTVVNMLKPRYIEWLAIERNVKKVRKEYTRLSEKQPYSKEMYNVMCRIERSSFTHDLSFLEDIHRLAIKHFGRDDIDPWLNMVNFYLYVKIGTESNKKSEAICEQAKKELQDVDFCQFEHKYRSLLKDFDDKNELMKFFT